MKRLLMASAVAALLVACAPNDAAVNAEQQWRLCDGQTPPEQKLAACSAVIAHATTSPERRAAAFVNRGALRARFSQHARAMADFGRALRIGGQDERALLERGLVHQGRGAFDEALVDIEAALALAPDMPQALMSREAVLRGRVEAFVNRLGELNQEIVAAPGEPGLLNERCWLRATNNDDLGLALLDCNESLRIAPDDANVLDSRGLVHLKQGDYSAALSDYEAALALTPGRGHYLYGRGLARRGLGMKAEAAADLTAGATADPRVVRLYRGYGVEL